MPKLEPCPVCGKTALVFRAQESRLSLQEKLSSYRWLKENVKGFLYCHTDPHPGHKKLIWHVIASNNQASCHRVLGPLVLHYKP